MYVYRDKRPIWKNIYKWQNIIPKKNCFNFNMFECSWIKIIFLYYNTVIEKHDFLYECMFDSTQNSEFTKEKLFSWYAFSFNVGKNLLFFFFFLKNLMTKFTHIKCGKSSICKRHRFVLAIANEAESIEWSHLSRYNESTFKF